MSLVHFLRDGRRLTGLTPHELKEMEELLIGAKWKLYSSDYHTLYFPLTAMLEDNNLVDTDITFNKTYSFDTFMGSPTYGRVLVSVNPELYAFFKEVVFPTVVEPGEFIFITGKAKKNMKADELKENIKWLFRITALGG